MTVKMALTSLLVCSDAQAVQVLSRILQILGITVKLAVICAWPTPGFAIDTSMLFWWTVRDQPAALDLFAQARKTPANHKYVVAIAIVSGRNEVRGIFAKGANFILYKPISRERLRVACVPRAV